MIEINTKECPLNGSNLYMPINSVEKHYIFKHQSCSQSRSVPVKTTPNQDHSQRIRISWRHSWKSQCQASVGTCGRGDLASTREKLNVGLACLWSLPGVGVFTSTTMSDINIWHIYIYAMQLEFSLVDGLENQKHVYTWATEIQFEIVHGLIIEVNPLV